MKKIILASQSPRRKDLLQQIGLSFEVIPSYIDEVLDEQGTIAEKIEGLALNKAMDVARKVEEEALIIGADTVVLLKEVLGKPIDSQDAFRMLRELSGKTHQVITGIAVVNAVTGKHHTAHQVTNVTMKDYSTQDIESYIASGEYWDKAGSYAIQGLGALLVKEIQGDYFNVVGLPIGLLDELLKKFDTYLFSIVDHGKPK